MAMPLPQHAGMIRHTMNRTGISKYRVHGARFRQNYTRKDDIGSEVKSFIRVIKSHTIRVIKSHTVRVRMLLLVLLLMFSQH
jgi:hypothetical protein